MATLSVNKNIAAVVKNAAHSWRRVKQLFAQIAEARLLDFGPA
jgi:hypothetical protein